MKNHSVSIYLDTRRSKANGKYPVKLRVFQSAPRRQKLYSTVFEFSKSEFESIWETNRPRKKHKEIRSKLQAVELKAYKTAESIDPFSFEQFEKKLYRKAGDGINISYRYSERIAELREFNQISTCSTYELSQKSLAEYAEVKKKQNFDKLTFYDIRAKWLNEYEYYMTEEKGLSLTTVSMYLRTLRAVFNRTIDEGEIDKAVYPFGKRKYQFPAKKNVKKALSAEQLGILFNAEPKNKQQGKAKDFWFFSYACNGINIKDIALLKYKDIKNDRIEFIRSKTRRTSKKDLKTIIVYLNEFSSEIIERYGRDEKIPESYVFDILTEELTAQEQKVKIQNFTRFINQHIKKLAKANELPEEISTYWARHSFATNAIRKGAGMEFIQESLGHSNQKTTQSYFAGFDDKAKKEFSNSIMDF
ncbi:MAG: site-specific integrase [Bacteroidota bacterium]|nr:site-specific integrase [Bacteroidota bacterium]